MNPRTLGPYQLHRMLGHGGMAEVFLATTKAAGGHRRALAVKCLFPHLSADEEIVSMLADEARLSVWLQHPNIVQVLDFGRTEGTYYVALEYVDGCDLRSLVRAHHGSETRGRPLPLSAALYAIDQVLQGLDYAHQRNDQHGKPLEIIHRDVSPHNVLVSRFGEVKLTDFGLARASISSHRTEAGVVRGKFSYMPKEQAHGLAIDQRVDLFAAGVTLYQMLTGLKPYSSVSLAQQLYQLEQPVVPPSVHVSGIPPEVDQLTMRAMSPDPQQRYRTARSMLEDVAAARLLLDDHAAGAELLAALVTSTSPALPDEVAGIPVLALMDLQVPHSSLIGDAIRTAQQGFSARATGVADAAGAVPAMPAFDELPPSRPIEPTLQVDEGEPLVEHSAPRAAPRRRHRRSTNNPDHQRREPSRAADPASSLSLDELDELEHGFSVDHQPQIEQKIDQSAGYYDSQMIDAVHGQIDTGTRPPPRRRERSSRASADKTAEPAPASNEPLLVGALRRQAKRERRGRRVQHGPVTAFHDALARHRPSPENESTLLVKRPRSGPPLVVRMVLAAALLGFGLLLGWLLRDGLEANSPPSIAESALDGPAAPPRVLPQLEPGFGKPRWADAQATPPGQPPAASIPAVPEEIDGDRRQTAAADHTNRDDDEIPGRSPAATEYSRKRNTRSPHHPGSFRRSRTARRSTPREQPPPQPRVEAATPPRPKPPTRSTAGQGTLRILSESPAIVLIDDEEAGQAPASLLVSPGIHRVKLVFDNGTESAVQWVSVEAGRTVRASF